MILWTKDVRAHSEMVKCVYFRLLSLKSRLEQLVNPAVNPRNSLSHPQDPRLLTEASPPRLIYSLFLFFIFRPLLTLLPILDVH
jgi:hypothetical protein